MSRTRGQRQRLRRIAYRITLVVLTVVLLAALALVACLSLQIEQYRTDAGGRIRAPVLSIESFGVPEERMGDYEAACQRYVEENHLEIQPFGTMPRTIP